MDPSEAAKHDGKARKAFNTSEATNYINANYELKYDSSSDLSATGLMKIAELIPKYNNRDLPFFLFRWDQKDNALDIDPENATPRLIKKFRKGERNFLGHHSVKEDGNDRIFRVNIIWDGERIFEGDLSFNLGFSVKSAVSEGLAVKASKTK